MAYLPYQNEPMLREALEDGPKDEYLEEASDRIADIVGTSPSLVRSQALANLAKFVRETHSDPWEAIWWLHDLDQGLTKWIGRILAARVLKHPIVKSLAQYDRGEITLNEIERERDQYVGDYTGQSDWYGSLPKEKKLIHRVASLAYHPDPFNFIVTLRQEGVPFDLMDAIVEGINTYPPVTEVTRKKERRKRDHWGIPEGLSDVGRLAAQTIKDVLKKYDHMHSGGQQVFMSPQEWKEHGHPKTKALLVILHDGGDHRMYFDPDEGCYGCVDRMAKALEKIGLYTELGSSWYSTVWRR